MILIILLVLLWSNHLAETPKKYFVIWNVGQGSWSTYISQTECWHFDAGGEKFPAAVKQCRSKVNFVFVSHDDWDHISFVRKIAAWNACLVKKPRKVFSESKEKLFDSFKKCPPLEGASEINWEPHGKKPNDLSRVYFLKNPGVLIPGDSTRSEEKYWGPKVAGLKIKWWLLGHHGSLSSSSKTLVELVGKPMAVASARWAKYHHPHPIVEARLRQKGIPVLRTEDWGNIWISLD